MAGSVDRSLFILEAARADRWGEGDGHWNRDGQG